ncbi:heavy metal translocating P-type ATPase [Novosphingobium aquimarinum]|uniref:heavy metal translocating P-type ATPase n=1 Tax=Novosphingobium aquimarinum TaxID=2682494 RepID=UPI0012EC4911|nr:heavy metal translocating P-type ATPase [Novosphingobium aquimarinum]
MNAPIPTDLGPTAVCIDSRFTVPGMRCAGCIGKIERGLGAVPGVAAARVNFSAKRVAVSHVADLSEDQLLEHIRKLGFEAERASENPLARDDAETRRLLRALAVAGFGMMNIMLLSVSVWAGAGGETRSMFHWISALIAIPVIAYAGRPFFASAAMALRYRRTNMDVPISIGVILATALSLYDTATGGPEAYFDGAVMLLFFLLAGRALDAMMRARARAGIEALLGRMGQGAHVVEADGKTRWVSAEHLAPDMVVLVAAGEALAADGQIIEGNTSFDASMLTGESEPHPARTGDRVYAGTINVSAPVRVRVTAAAQDTAIADIARLMDEAGQSRSRYVRVADRAARLYAPAVHSLAVLAFVGWLAAGAGAHQALTIAVSVLIITCPCALGLAVPAAQVVVAGALLKRGLLIKDGSALERLAEVDMVLFDKTGTLTLGEPRPVDLGVLDEDMRSLALALAQASRHPLSRGLAAALRETGTTPVQLDTIEETPGSGLTACWQGNSIALVPPEDQSIGLACDLLIEGGRTRIAFADPRRPDLPQALTALAAEGVKAAILSGDRIATVEAFGRELDLPARGAMTPADKLAELDRLRAEGHRTLMVGDGLNDGPALAGAHVSIAPGSASDVSRQAADAVFTGERLMPVVLALRAARMTRRIVRQNFALAAGYNLLAVPLALAGLVTPLLAAVAMSVSSLVVVANSLRLANAAKERVA